VWRVTLATVVAAATVLMVPTMLNIRVAVVALRLVEVSS
jgi:hypothetical protein